ncbi:MAG: trypsin-like peptidase domain-containing protein [Burkholderiaceae bacterium]
MSLIFCLPLRVSLIGVVLALLTSAVSAAAPVTPANPAKPREISPRGALHNDEKRDVELFKRLSPSVVHINTATRGLNPFTASFTEVHRGSGTGFVWDPLGHIVTNYHVVAESDHVAVTLFDQSVWPARRVGEFADRDLVVLRIDAPPEKLKPIPLGTSRGLQVGQRVYAIGNPFGLDQTMTTGIVSALDREIPGNNNRTLRGVIQSDAAINPGNSGGPLLDSGGLLIGVTTAIFSPSGASVGIGFAIPADEVNRIVPRLINDGRFIRPVLGIEGAPVRFLESLGLAPGVPVISMIKGGPADKAGLRAFRRISQGRIVVGDVVIGISQFDIRTLDDLYAALEKYLPGDLVEVRVRRVDEVMKLKIRLAQGD